MRKFHDWFYVRSTWVEDEVVGPVTTIELYGLIENREVALSTSVMSPTATQGQWQLMEDCGDCREILEEIEAVRKKENYERMNQEAAKQKAARDRATRRELRKKAEIKQREAEAEAQAALIRAQWQLQAQHANATREQLPQFVPIGEIIHCFVCKKRVADNAPTCPHCGAEQSSEGRTQGKAIKDTQQLIGLGAASVFGVGLLVLVLFCANIVNSGSSVSPSNTSSYSPSYSSSPSYSRSRSRSVPRGWDVEKLERDSWEVASDPNDSKTMFIPLDGSQPFIVPNPDVP